MKVIKCERCKELKEVNRQLKAICGLYAKAGTHVNNPHNEWLAANLDRLEWERVELDKTECVCIKVHQPPLSNTGVKI